MKVLSGVIGLYNPLFNVIQSVQSLGWEPETLSIKLTYFNVLRQNSLIVFTKVKNEFLIDLKSKFCQLNQSEINHSYEYINKYR